MLVVKIASNHKMPPAECISFFKAIAKRTSKNQEACRENRKFSITLHRALIDAGYDVKNQGGWESDTFWDWS